MEEPGSEAAESIWRAATRRISSRLLYPEARAGLAAAGRAGRLPARALPTARSTLETLCVGIAFVELAPSLARRAGDLAERHGLRGYDAVHLSSVEAVADADTVLVAAGGPLLEAAEADGISIARLL